MRLGQIVLPSSVLSRTESDITHNKNSATTMSTTATTHYNTTSRRKLLLVGPPWSLGMPVEAPMVYVVTTAAPKIPTAASILQTSKTTLLPPHQSSFPCEELVADTVLNIKNKLWILWCTKSVTRHLSSDRIGLPVVLFMVQCTTVVPGTGWYSSILPVVRWNILGYWMSPAL